MIESVVLVVSFLVIDCVCSSWVFVVRVSVVFWVRWVSSAVMLKCVSTWFVVMCWLKLILMFVMLVSIFIFFRLVVMVNSIGVVSIDVIVCFGLMLCVMMILLMGEWMMVCLRLVCVRSIVTGKQIGRAHV